jgi:hypothetical protein
MAQQTWQGATIDTWISTRKTGAAKQDRNALRINMCGQRTPYDAQYIRILHIRGDAETANLQHGHIQRGQPGQIVKLGGITGLCGPFQHAHGRNQTPRLILDHDMLAISVISIRINTRHTEKTQVAQTLTNA